MSTIVKPTQPDFLDDTELPDLGESEDILAGLDQVNQQLEDKRGKKKEEEAKDAPKEPPKYKQEVLLNIFDSLVFEGKYIEEFKGRGMTLVLRSRTGEDTVNISRAVDRFEGKTYMSVQTYSNLLTLSHSLVAYNGKTFQDKEIKEKFAYLSTIPDAILTILVGKLQQFDEKVWLAMEEGRKNF